MKRIFFALVTLMMVCSCSVYKTFKSPEPKTANLCGENRTTQDSWANQPAWKEVFADSLLQQLIEKGLMANTDLQVARLNIEQAEARLLASRLAYLPSFAVTPEGSISKGRDGETVKSYTLPLTMQWEVDVFGKLRNSKLRARAQLLQSSEYTQMIQVQLIASIANNYYTLLMLDEQLRITRQSIQNQKENLEVIIAMKEAGMQTEAAVNQASADYYNVMYSEKELMKQIRLVENCIALLINETPHTIARVSINEIMAVNVDYTVPISLLALANRPDVKQAEYVLESSFYGVNIARSSFYPSISLGGSTGWTNDLGGIANPGSILLSAIGSLTQPLFNKGVNRANLKIAKARYEQSLLQFEKTLLVAGSEVNDALIACQSSMEKITMRQQQLESSLKAYENSQDLMQHSSRTYLEVLVAQSASLQSQLMLVADCFEGIQGQINLYKALGGGANELR
ncbi:TolC family protein [Parabacteroides gordonii]|uniref:TolC family protein n=1 Tax=Parabacteroides gordonii TaxID=574930 RepID=UPI0026EB145F|nr:TolC family protein [Parabacteroides gordonii]